MHIFDDSSSRSRAGGVVIKCPNHLNWLQPCRGSSFTNPFFNHYPHLRTVSGTSHWTETSRQMPGKIVFHFQLGTCLDIPHKGLEYGVGNREVWTDLTLLPLQPPGGQGKHQGLNCPFLTLSRKVSTPSNETHMSLSMPRNATLIQYSTVFMIMT